MWTWTLSTALWVTLTLTLTPLIRGEEICPVRVKYFHIQDLTGSFEEILTVLQSGVIDAATQIVATYPGSGFGFAGLWDKPTTNAYCYTAYTGLTDVPGFTDAVMSAKAGGGSQYGGQDGFTALWHATFGDEVNWAYNDDDVTFASLPEARIIAIASDDEGYYDYDAEGGSNDNKVANTNFNFPQNYDHSYDPTDMKQCTRTGYPALQNVAQAVVDADTYFIVFAMTSGKGLTDPYSYWTNITGPAGMNLGARAVVMEVDWDQHDLAPAILSVVSQITCNIVHNTTEAPVTSDTGTGANTVSTTSIYVPPIPCQSFPLT